jgi:heme/copper-type cytochrome/quinol oxidase subunit 1
MITFGALYFLVPRLWNRERLYSLSLVNWHFWLATIGIVLYASSMWVTGIMEGLMWREVDAQGFLVNSFADTVTAKFPMYVVRALGGALFVAGGAADGLQSLDDGARVPPSRRATMSLRSRRNKESPPMSVLSKHSKIEKNAFLLLVLSFFVVTIGGIVQIVPLFYLDNVIEEVDGMRPYSARSSSPGGRSTSGRAAISATPR